MIYDLIIIGAGASGLFAAAYLAQKDPKMKVLVLEKTSQPASKLLLSGSGQCNFTHNSPPEDYIQHYGSHGKSLKHVLYNFTANDSMFFFKTLDIPSFIREDGKVFPASLKASDISDGLLKLAQSGKIEFKLNQNITNIEAFDLFFAVKTTKTSYQTKKILITVGGKSYPITGSDGSLYPLIEKLGHTLIPIKPALCPPVIKKYHYASLTGISFQDLPMTLVKPDNKKKHFKGDMVFTHFSISGPLILDASRYFEKEDKLIFNFTPFSSYEAFLKDYSILIKRNPRKIIKNILSFYSIPQALILIIFNDLKLSPSIDFHSISKEKHEKLLKALYAFELVIESPGSFKMAMCTAGGVSLKELNMKTMESKLLKDLYFAGEVIDADGDTGGYNIHAAFAEAKTAIDHIIG